MSTCTGITLCQTTSFTKACFIHTVGNVRYFTGHLYIIVHNDLAIAQTNANKIGVLLMPKTEENN